MTAARELTVRAVAAGCAIGALLAVANVYMGLKTGWADSGNITAATLGFALFSGLGRRDYSRLENNVTQTTASASAFMAPTLGLLTAVPALELMGVRPPSWALLAFGLALAALGVAAAIPLRALLIDREQLKFPTGLATAELIELTFSSARRALGRARALVASALVSGALGWLRDGRPAWLPQVLDLPLTLAGVPAGAFTLGVAVSPMMFAVGIFIGPRSGLSMALGALIAWGVIAPRLAAAGLVGAPVGYPTVMPWMVWPGVALLISSALVELVLAWRTIGRAIADLGRLRGVGRARLELGLGLGAVAALVVVGRAAFGLHPLATLLAIALALVFAVVGARGAGETDIAPLGAAGQFTQLTFASLWPRAPVVNLAAGDIASGGGTQTAALLWSWRAGERLGADPRRQLIAHLIGCVTGAAAALGAYRLIAAGHALGGDTLPAPGALAWKAVAVLVAGGAASLPPQAALAAGAGAALGVVLALGSRTRWRAFCPSPVALGVGVLTPAFFAATVALGALGLALVQRRAPRTARELADPIAAGGIAGESLSGVAVAALHALGLLGK